jgi:hypothetical protein
VGFFLVSTDGVAKTHRREITRATPCGHRLLDDLADASHEGTDTWNSKIPSIIFYGVSQANHEARARLKASTLMPKTFHCSRPTHPFFPQDPIIVGCKIRIQEIFAPLLVCTIMRMQKVSKGCITEIGCKSF